MHQEGQGSSSTGTIAGDQKDDIESSPIFENGNQHPSNVIVLRCTPVLQSWMTTIRDSRTDGAIFHRTVEQVSRMLLYEGRLFTMRGITYD